MRTFFPRLAAAAAAVALSLPLALAAQAPAGTGFGVSGGATFPTGDFGKSFKSGFEVGAHLGVRPEGWPVGLRFDGMYDRFDAKTSPLNVGPTAHTDILGFTGNLRFALSGTPEAIRPYLIGGAGIYNVKLAVGGASTRETKFGLNGGAGLDMPLSGIAVFLEARLHYLFTDSGTNTRGYDARFIPVVVGVRF